MDGNSNKATSNGKTIQWNNNSVIGDNRPGYVGLGHEMAHTQDQWKGTLDLTTWTTVIDANGNTVDIPNADKYATHIENQIRSEHNISLRPSYAIDGAGSPVPATAIINGNESKFYTNGSIQTTTIVNGSPIITISTLPFRYKK